MIIWLTGNSGAGKTTLAELIKLISPDVIHLDGDDIRERVTGFDLGEKDRRAHNLNVARWAKLLSDQGKTVIVSLICPYEDLREEIKRITHCQFVYIEYPGDDEIEEKPYEKPKQPDYHFKRDL